MTTFIACFIAGLCVAGFVTIWFCTAYKELSEKQRSIAGLYEQLALHERLYAEARGGPNEEVSAGMLETNRMLCCEGAKSYNKLIKRPMNRIPALVLGFRTMKEKDGSKLCQVR